MSKNYKVAGVDEVGRGCLAGPVFAAAVILNNKINTREIKDSKKLSFNKRIALSKYIKKNSVYALGMATVREINKINILNASLLSMKRALSKLKVKPNLAYIDGPFAPSLNILNDEIKDHSNNIDIDSKINSNQLDNLNKISLHLST